MKIKVLVGFSMLLASGVAATSDSPFEVGQVYSLSPMTGISVTVEVKGVRGSWVLIEDKDDKGCSGGEHQCWVNTNIYRFAAKKAKEPVE